MPVKTTIGDDFLAGAGDDARTEALGQQQSILICGL
jgi:hypothetical protein